jgi:hypothetical protein
MRFSLFAALPIFGLVAYTVANPVLVYSPEHPVPALIGKRQNTTDILGQLQQLLTDIKTQTKAISMSPIIASLPFAHEQH